MYHLDSNKKAKISRSYEDSGLEIWEVEFMSKPTLIAIKDDLSHLSWKERLRSKLETEVFNSLEIYRTTSAYVSMYIPIET